MLIEMLFPFFIFKHFACGYCIKREHIVELNHTISIDTPNKTRGFSLSLVILTKMLLPFLIFKHFALGHCIKREHIVEFNHTVSVDSP
jgi:hypothetical protein